jgi:hypothetical protein
VPNRRRRRLSTAMSTVAALAVASPIAITAVSELSHSANQPAPQHRQFVQASMVTDLPNELMSALSQGLSQFGINLPPMPTSLLTGSGGGMPTTLTSPGLGTSPLTTPGLGLPPSPTGLTDPALTNPALTNPALTSPTGLPGLGTTPPAGAVTTPALPGLTTPSTPGLTTPSVPGLTTPSVTDPTAAALSPISNATGLPSPGEVPISAPIGLDPTAGTYPILGGDPSLSGIPASTGSPGLLGDLGSAANQLGAGQAIDLLKGVLMPAIMSAMKPPGAPVAAAAAAAPAAAAPITQAAGTAPEVNPTPTS